MGTSKKLNSKFKHMQQECLRTQQHGYKLAESKNKLLNELESQKRGAKKDKEKAETYRKLCESMKQKLSKLEDGVQSAKQDQLRVQKILKEKSDNLIRTQEELNALKAKKAKKHSKIKKKEHEVNHQSKKEAIMKKRLKKQEEDLRKAEEEKKAFMREIEE